MEQMKIQSRLLWMFSPEAGQEGLLLLGQDPRDPGEEGLVEAALGVGSIIDFENDESDAGLGLLIGLGYEFAAHWQVGMSWSFTQIGDDQIGDIDIDTRIETFRFGVTWLGY